MQLFRQALSERLRRIEKATYCDVRLVGGENGEFSLIATWIATRAGPAGTHRIVFTKQRVLGPTACLPRSKQRMVKKTCRVADDVIAELQNVRGLR